MLPAGVEHQTSGFTFGPSDNLTWWNCLSNIVSKLWFWEVLGSSLSICPSLSLSMCIYFWLFLHSFCLFISSCARGPTHLGEVLDHDLHCLAYFLTSYDFGASGLLICKLGYSSNTLVLWKFEISIMSFVNVKGLNLKLYWWVHYIISLNIFFFTLSALMAL